MRILGLDYGAKTVGVAVTDPLMLTAQCVTTITREREDKLRRTFAQIESIIAEYEVDTVVLGLPLNMDGTIGPRAQKTIDFHDALEKRLGMKVELMDERLTTVSARETLDETGYSKDRKERKKVVDQLAAQIILEDYMQRIKSEENYG